MLRKIAFWTVFVLIWLALFATMFLAGAGKMAAVVGGVLVIVLMVVAFILDPAGVRTDPPRPRGVRHLSHLDQIISDVLWDEFNGEKKEQAEWDG